MGRKRYTARQFIDAILRTGGIIGAIAKNVGCTWHTAKKYCTQYPSVARVYQDECESILDMAEVELIQQIRNGEQWAVKYILSTKGKQRGFTEKQEVDVTSGGKSLLDIAEWKAKAAEQLTHAEQLGDMDESADPNT